MRCEQTLERGGNADIGQWIAERARVHLGFALVQ